MDHPTLIGVRGLSVLPLFDEAMARDVIAEALRSAETTGSAGEVLSALQGSGLIYGVGEALRVREPIRRRLAETLRDERPDLYRAVQGIYARHARNGFGDATTRTLGPRLSHAMGEVLGALSTDDADVLARLVEVWTGSDFRSEADVLRVTLSTQPQTPSSRRGGLYLDAMSEWHYGSRSRACDLFRSLVDVPDRIGGIAEHLLGVQANATGQQAAAVAHLQRSLKIVRAHEDHVADVKVLTTLGRVERDRALASRTTTSDPSRESIWPDLGSSVDALTAAIETAELHGLGPGLIFDTYVELAVTYRRSGLLGEAERTARNAVGVAGDPAQLVRALTTLGSVCRDRGMPGEAAKNLDVAVETAKRHDVVGLDLAIALNVLASSELRLPRMRVKAQEHARESVRLGRKLHNRRHLSHALITLARTLIPPASRKNAAEARKALEEAEVLMRALDDERNLQAVADLKVMLLRSERKGRRRRFASGKEAMRTGGGGSRGHGGRGGVR